MSLNIIFSVSLIGHELGSSVWLVPLDGPWVYFYNLSEKLSHNNNNNNNNNNNTFIGFQQDIIHVIVSFVNLITNLILENLKSLTPKKIMKSNKYILREKEGSHLATCLSKRDTLIIPLI
jgi:hypothetical protein